METYKRHVSAQVTKRESDHLKIGGDSEEDREKLRMEAQRMGKQISALLWRMPRELLLLLKTNDCLRSVDHALGQVGALLSQAHAVQPIQTFASTQSLHSRGEL